MNKLITALGAAAILALMSPSAMAQDSVMSSAQGGGAAQSQTLAQDLSVVHLAQMKLKEAGLYNGRISGIRTVATERALRRYQRANNLRVTGTITAETRAAMGI